MAFMDIFLFCLLPTAMYGKTLTPILTTLADGASLEIVTSEWTTVSAVYSDWSKPLAHVADGRPHEGIFTLLALQPSLTPRCVRRALELLVSRYQGITKWHQETHPTVLCALKHYSHRIVCTTLSTYNPASIRQHRGGNRTIHLSDRFLTQRRMYAWSASWLYLKTVSLYAEIDLAGNRPIGLEANTSGAQPLN